MPPGYMVLLGLVFKAAGFSFLLARDISWLGTVAAMTGILVLFKGFRLRALVIVLACPFMLGTHFVLAGNIARMDSLLLAIAAWGFVLLGRGNLLAGLALLAAAMLVHPNALYFLGAGTCWAACQFHRQRLSPRRWEWIPALAAAVLWMLYGLLAWRHSDAFLQDMAYQFSRKSGRSWTETMTLTRAVPLALLAGTAAAGLLLRLRTLLPLLFAAACLVIQVMGNELWYQFFFCAGLAVTLAVLLETVHAGLSALHGLPDWTRRTATGGLLVSILAGSLFLGVIPNPRNYPASLDNGLLRIPNKVRYHRPEDTAILLRTLQEMGTGPETPVIFRPSAVALIHWPAIRELCFPVDPHFTKVYDESPRIQRVSRFHNELVGRTEPPPASLSWIQAGMRDETESWWRNSAPGARQHHGR